MRRLLSWSAVCAGLLSILVTGGCKNPQLSGGILHFDQKRYDRARETLLNAVAQEPQNAEAYLWLGKAYAEMDSTQQARASFDKSIELADQLSLPAVKSDAQTALAHYWSERHNQALLDAKAAQEAKAQEKPAEAEKNFRAALDKFKRARVYDPSRAETPRNMGVIYFNLGHTDSGLVALRQSHELDPSGDAAKILFDQYRLLGDQAAEKGAGAGGLESLDDAVALYSEAEKIKGDDADLLFSLGVVHFQIAENDESRRQAELQHAAHYFEKTLDSNPEDEEALYNAASLHLELKTCEEGLALARRLLDLDARKGRYHDLQGRLLDCMGQKSERIAGLIFSRALSENNSTKIDVGDNASFRSSLEGFGPTSDLMRKFREEGKPEDIREFRDINGNKYVAWFYWTRGKGFAFMEGDLKYQTQFKPQKSEEELGAKPAEGTGSR